MADTICNLIASYLETFTATNAVCVALGGVTITAGVNLYIIGEVATTGDSLNLIPYGGSPPNIDGNRQNPSIQIESRTTTKAKALGVQQALINTLHMNEMNGNGLVTANQSAPIILRSEQGGRSIIAVSNYEVQMLKI